MAISKYQSFIESSSINGANAPYVEAYYEQFLDDPESIDPSWRAYFRLIQDQNAPREVPHSEVIARFERLAREPHRVVAAEAGFDAKAAEQQAGVLRLLNYYRMRGDRKSDVSGKSVSVRVDLGGRRIIQKKITTRHVRLNQSAELNTEQTTTT